MKLSTQEKMQYENKRIMRIWRETQSYAYFGGYSVETNKILYPKSAYQIGWDGHSTVLLIY